MAPGGGDGGMHPPSSMKIYEFYTVDLVDPYHFAIPGFYGNILMYQYRNVEDNTRVKFSSHCITTSNRRRELGLPLLKSSLQAPLKLIIVVDKATFLQ